MTTQTEASDPATAPPPLNRLDVLRGLRISILEGVWATVFANLTGGAFQIGFVLMLGASPFVLGVLASVPPLVGLLQLPASLYVEKRGERKNFVAFCAFASRLLWLPILLIPFIFPNAVGLWVFVALFALASALGTVTVPAWTSWISDLVPPASRGQFFARRNTLAAIVTLLVPLPAGALLDQAMKYDRFDARIAFAVLFGLAVAAAAVSFTLIRRQPEPPFSRAEKPPPILSDDGNIRKENPLKALAAPLTQDPAFRAFLFYAGVLTAGQTFAGQFFTSWQVSRDALNLPYLTVQLLGALTAGAGLLALPVFGFLADKYGSRPVLVLSCFGVLLAPTLWLLTIARPEAFWWNIALIVVINVAAGAFWAGVGLSQFNLLLSVSPEAQRAKYVAVYSAFTGLVGGIAPLLGGLAMTALQDLRIPFGDFGLEINNYKVMFFGTLLLRVLCLYLLSRVPRDDGQSTRYLLRQLSAARPVTSFLAARRVAQPVSESVRRMAVDSLGDLRTPLAVEELATALEDVSHAVRENAARALGKIGDARAVEYLAAKLSDPAAGIGETVAHALGEIGDRRATVSLMNAVVGEDATVRVAALRALARLADPNALPALLGALTPASPTACESACAALAATATRLSPQQTETAAHALLPLLNEDAPRGVRLAAARALTDLSDGDGENTTLRKESRLSFALSPLQAAILRETDASVIAQEASALVCLANNLGTPAVEQMPLLMEALEKVESGTANGGGGGIAYKQALNALAETVLPDGAFYPMLGVASDIARDELLQKRLADLVRQIRRDSDVRHDAHNIPIVADALAALGNGDYRALICALSLLRGLSLDAASLIAALCARAEQRETADAIEALLAVVVALHIVRATYADAGE